MSTINRMTERRTVLLSMLAVLCVMPLCAQSAFEHIVRNRYFSASNYCIYPDSITPKMTPPPDGKRPFYISHYGRHGSRYLNNRKGYDIPYQMLCKADSMGELTEQGKQVKQQLALIISDSEGRWGDLSGIGKLQQHNIARRMVERFPEVFRDHARIEARSTTVNRCVLSMGSFLQQVASMCPKVEVMMDARKNDLWYMNHQDKQLRNNMEDETTLQAFRAFSSSREHNPKLMAELFVHPDTMRKAIDEVELNYYIIKAGVIQQNTHMRERTNLIDYVAHEDIHRFWQKENAWWYLMYGPSPLNGGKQPYTQRHLLRQIITDADSCLSLSTPGATLRFGHETVVLPLACLLGINGFDQQIDDLEDLEEYGWWAGMVFPMASNIQFVFYRSAPNDRNVLFKVLLNEQEATLPLKTDMAPYYRWKDFRKYFLKKLDNYEALRR